MRKTFRKRYKPTTLFKHKKEYFIAILWKVSLLREVRKTIDQFKKAFERL